MRKSPIWRGDELVSAFLWLALLASLSSASTVGTAPQQETDPPRYSTLVDSQIERLKNEVERTRALVENGTLARTRLKEAEERLADAEDEGKLATTLYGSTPVEKFTEQQADAMMTAARHRVDRQSALVEERRTLLEGGAISQSEFEAFTAELETRRQVLVLAQNRLKLLQDLRQMAEAEKRLERITGPSPGTLQNSMIRFAGNGAFSLADVPTITAQFSRKFHHQLPVSALGQTLLHESLGLDHRNRVDVALSPDSPEGLWLRSLLEKLRVPYLAFRNAVAGAATAPHIHIGVESTRLRVLDRR